MTQGSYEIVNANEAAFASAWPGSRVVVSTDRKKWRSIPTSYDDKKGVLSWTHTSLKDVCYFAYFAPYTMEMHADLLSRCAASPIARIQTLGATLDGRAMDCVVAGTGPMHAWINARQHCFNALV